ncbi:uncharacterized protein [Dermacentor albipictus]|uniref:uncharacterized protein isoform X2 n=1 Tax=Dermacentor albipictus TaxID=60249 RepID=UPI0038FCAFB1
MLTVFIQQYEVLAMVFSRELFACVSILVLTHSTTSGTMDESHRAKMPVIGRNVSMDAYVFYDETYNMSTSGDDNYSTQLFEEVQSYLHNRSIMVNITVKLAVEKKNLTVYFEGTHIMDGNHTLENLTKFGESMKKPKNSVFFLFSWATEVQDERTAGLIDFIYPSDPHRLGVSEVATENTFCTTNTSAAVIRHKHKSKNFWSTTRALLTVFGSRHFLNFTKKDWDTMNETFSRCRHLGELEDMPAC